MNVLLVFTGRRFATALDIPRERCNADDELPELNWGPIEITTRFDSEEGVSMRLCLEMLRKRLVANWSGCRMAGDAFACSGA